MTPPTPPPANFKLPDVPALQTNSQNESKEPDLTASLPTLVRVFSRHPTRVTMEERIQSDIRRVSICVDQADFDLFTASNGRTFLALQTAFNAMARKEKSLATLDVICRQTGSRLE